ncbi:MAG: 30S ribosomal protein S2 [Deltaproteobacteria bacterium]|nr:MAG: 30S ribosomal protein S2 [Deltaproteobacteria bacterium]
MTTETAPETAGAESIAPTRIVTIRELLEAGAHFGHRTDRWNPKMRPFIFGVRNGIHIIDLQQTAVLFRRAFAFIRSVAMEGKPILFVGTKKQAQDIVMAEAIRASQFFVNFRWLGGTLTNWKTIRQSIDKLRRLEKMEEDGTYEKLTKKEVLRIQRQRAKLERNLGGIKDMPDLPGAVFVVDPTHEHIAVAEANRLEIPVVALADTNADPDLIDYIIPANDDAIRSIKLACTRMADACIEGARLGKQRAVAASAAEVEDAPETIRVHTGGDGPKVELVSRRTQLPPPEAAASPEAEEAQAAAKAPAPEAT